MRRSCYFYRLLYRRPRFRTPTTKHIRDQSLLNQNWNGMITASQVTAPSNLNHRQHTIGKRNLKRARPSLSTAGSSDPAFHSWLNQVEVGVRARYYISQCNLLLRRKSLCPNRSKPRTASSKPRPNSHTIEITCRLAHKI